MLGPDAVRGAVCPPWLREVTLNAMDRPEERLGPANPDICGRCAAVGSTCCVLTPGQEETCFPVSEIERQRIVDHLGPSRGAFVVEANSGAFLANLYHLFPRERQRLAALFPETGRHLRLAVTPAGRCVFLRASGCCLPRQVRPYYCRLFPFWVSGGRLTAFAAAGCLVHSQGRNMAAMLALVGTSEARARELHGRLRLAWGLPPKEGMPFVTPSPARTGT